MAQNQKSKRRIWTAEMMEVLNDESLSIQQKAEKLGLTYWTVANKRRGYPYRLKGGYGHLATNKERRARYNAKIKEHGYKPIKDW